MIEFTFYFFSIIAIGSAFLCITRQSPVASALWLVLTLFSIAALFVILQAHFIAALQVAVYAGAIMVLFLFVIMLLNVGRGGTTDLSGWTKRLLMLGIGAVLAVELWAVTQIVPADELRLPAGAVEQMAVEEGAVHVVAMPLFQEYLLPFEITSLLLLSAMVGAVVMAKRRL